MNILADAALPNLVALFTPSFSLTLYKKQDEIADLLPSHDILLCRSTLKVTAQLLTGSKIKCVATASSGVDHIDSHYLTQQGIHLFDAKGCNARSVADYVVATLAFSDQNKQILGKKAGVIGVGEVGTRVVARLQAAGFDVICYDPLRAKLDTHYDYRDLDELTTCDLLCVHANLHDTPPYPSVNLLDADFFSQLKPGTTIINAARGGIINEEALLKTETPITYCTDVYQGEPAINAAIIDFATLCTPHIAGHSIEAKCSAVLIISQQLHQLYGLPMPSTAMPLANAGSVISSIKGAQWQDYVLALYNPLLDTQILKQASNKKFAFLMQRQAHQNRHDFSFYNARQLDQSTQSLLGQ